VLSLSASDRAGLLYAMARVLARHEVNLQLAKILTLGERVEDSLARQRRGAVQAHACNCRLKASCSMRWR
jgi:UTP:GlnB (protein PII) uridylyltransferase